jgi:hypothetical protein
MQPNMIRPLLPAFVILLIAVLACNLPAGAATPVPPAPQEQILVAIQPTTAPPTVIPATATVVVSHTMTPSDPRGGKRIYDVESSGTAPEKRAPYGDSYDMNRLERPFQQDMAYLPDLDIVSFTVAKDSDWWYVSIELVGADPNHVLGINYGVELDLDRDGFGDYLIWVHPPYTNQWNTTPVQIFQDQNHNTGGLSGAKSDAAFAADGYETLVFDGSTGGTDPDIAWMRIHAGPEATVQIAFKRSWSGTVFMLGIIADAGWKDPGKLDYVDRIPIAEAGSPVKENMHYPLKALFLVDNTCREGFGFEPTRYEPQICPVEPTPTKEPREPGSPPAGPTLVVCQPQSCKAGWQWDSEDCQCELIPPY